MLKWIAQNKYKAMAFIVGMYLLVDMAQHKGQVRVLFPKQFSITQYGMLEPQSNNTLKNRHKNWVKAVNTRDQMNRLSVQEAGFECDVYFDTTTKSFDVHHDPGKTNSYRLDELLQVYQQKKMQAGIWLDIKNLDDSNAASCLTALITLRNIYDLQGRILVESGRADLLAPFTGNSFYTAFYIPFFNPYRLNDQQTQLWADSIAARISRSKINALSGYYFQCSFLNHYFPKYPVLTWVDNTSFSLVNRFFLSRIAANKSIFIVLKP
jgi:hypothetical protein